MAWRPILETDLVAVISSTELEALRAAALKAGQADPVSPSILSVTDEVRGHIAACAENTLGDAGEIPEKLLDTACILIMEKIITLEIPAQWIQGLDLDQAVVMQEIIQ